MPSSPQQSAIDDLEQLRKPLIVRAIALLSCFCLLMIVLTASSLVASRRGELEDTATSTANMARALASHAERSIKIADTVLSEMADRAEHGELNAETTARLHARLQNRDGHA